MRTRQRMGWICVPPNLQAEMDAISASYSALFGEDRKRINWSAIAAQAFRDELARLRSEIRAAGETNGVGSWRA